VTGATKVVEHVERNDSTVKFRPATVDDLAAVMDMIHAGEVFDEGYVRTPIDAELSSWAYSAFDLATDSLAAWDGARCLGIAEVYDMRPEHVFFSVYLNARPADRDGDVPERLVEFIEGRLDRFAELAAPGLRVAGFTVAQRAGWTLAPTFTTRGWLAARHNWSMAIELTEPLSEPNWPDGIAVRVGTEADAEEVYRLEQEVFADHFAFVPMSYDDWRRFQDSYASTPDMWLLAYDGAELVGTALNTRERPEDPDLGYIGNLGVRRSHRGRGIALALLHASFRQLAELGAKRVKLDVDSENLTGATRLYQRAGMQVVEQRTTYAKDFRTGRTLWKEHAEG
jgi:ribosomal protein S18 acetylase RimI-like enzyme